MNKEYFSKHLSLSQWAIESNILKKEEIISEDATKRFRLDFLNKTIELPIVKTSTFNFQDINTPSPSFRSFIEFAGNSLYALRANPKEEGLPVFRNRRQPIDVLIKWILSSTIDFNKYQYDFELHVDPEISSIFVINDQRIIGEVISGGLLQLNKGLHGGSASTYFQFDFNNWKFSKRSNLVEEFLQEAIQCLTVKQVSAKKIIEKELNGSFANNVLKGYFEVIRSEQAGMIFVDYNRILQNNMDGLELFKDKIEKDDHTLSGQIGCAGKVRGRAKVILESDLQNTDIDSDEILICHFTAPEYVPLITKAAAVVTDIGGILSHAAIVCRELKKPCIIDTKVATEIIKDGDFIEVDANNGLVRFL